MTVVAAARQHRRQHELVAELAHDRDDDDVVQFAGTRKLCENRGFFWNAYFLKNLRWEQARRAGCGSGRLGCERWKRGTSIVLTSGSEA